MSIIETLTEGMVHRNMQQEGAALLNKWSATGLLEGLSNDEQKAGMARLLENQARELLRESNTMAGGDVEGFAAVAFPIVRRVFAGLIANDLVSVQPMSLPSGLIFFLDFKFSDTAPGTRLGQNGTESIYGQGVVASEITGGVQLNNETMDKQPYGLGSAYSSPTGSLADADVLVATTLSAGNVQVLFDGASSTAQLDTSTANVSAGQTGAPLMAAIDWDVDVISEYGSAGVANAGGYVLAIRMLRSDVEDAGATPLPLDASKINMDMLSQIHMPLHQFVDASPAATVNNGEGFVALTSATALQFKQVRRLTKYNRALDAFEFYYVSDTALGFTLAAGDSINFIEAGDLASTTLEPLLAPASFPMIDQLTDGGALGSVVGTTNWGLENNGFIPEIDIKVDSIAITAVTKKLKAKWTPELGQDLNAYHNLDAEVELTSILSEQIALEIDREILGDLINGATAGTFYWSCSPGMFVNRLTGAEIGASAAAPDFTGTVSEWYETLIETINDVSAQIHRKTLRGGANFVVLSPEVANILEFTAGFRANVTADADKGDIGAVKVGSLNRKFDVIVDPYFPRNAILVGRKGSSFLESGYVYAPYVPLQTTPTIFGPEDFVPRKGVMTRYGKKMVRPDMYGLVIVRDMVGSEGGRS